MINLDNTAVKASKAEAFAILLELKHGGTITQKQIDSMLLHFAPKTNEKAKTALEWVAKAAALKDQRIYLNYVCVTKGVAYASNGHVAHRADVSVADGYYCPKTLLRVDYNIPPIDYARIYNQGNNGLQLKTKLARTEKMPGGPKSGTIRRVTAHSFDEGAPDNIRERFIERQLLAAANGNVDPSFWLQPAGHDRFGGQKYRAYGFCEFGDWLVMSLND